MAGTKSILVVEDEAMIAMMLEDVLETLDYRLHATAATVEEACAIAREQSFDAAVLDCNLHGEKVWPVAEILIGRGIPFLFATGGTAADVPTALSAHPTVAKPFTIGSVERALQRILA